jgi:hypothetical protein
MRIALSIASLFAAALLLTPTPLAGLLIVGVALILL